MAHLDIASVNYTLADGRPPLNDVSFSVGETTRPVWDEGRVVRARG